jgi:hypothetical protein
MVKNTGKPYELLTKWIIEQLSEESGVNTIRIEHDVNLQGRDAVHQIDVLWEFEVGGFNYTTIIQAKDWWTRNIDQGKLIQFKGVLDDLPGQPRGIMVARKGFQKGAREFADKNKILIYELREPTEKDWDGRFKLFHINVNIVTPHFEDIKLNFDDCWNEQEFKKLRHLISEAPKIISDNLIFYDEAGVEITNALKLFTSLTPPKLEELPPTNVTHSFDKPTFVKTQDPRIRAKVNSVEVTISKQVKTIEYQLDGADFVGYILKNVLRGDVTTFPKRV